MMLGGRKKPDLTVIMKKLKGPEQEPAEQADAPLNNMETAAEELLQAIEAKDVQGLAAVLRSIIDLAEEEPAEEME